MRKTNSENVKTGVFSPVDVIASGYEWVCPVCGELNKEIEYLENYTCGRCKKNVETSPPEHAYG